MLTERRRKKKEEERRKKKKEEEETDAIQDPAPLCAGRITTLWVCQFYIIYWNYSKAYN